MILAAALRRRWAACAALAGTLVLVALVAPRFLPGEGEAEAPPADPLRVMSLNLAVGGADPDQVAELALDQSVDVIAFQELTPAATKVLASGPLGEEMPHAVLEARDGSFGSGIVSREPLEPLATPPVDTGKTIAAARISDADAVGGELDIWSIHPEPPTTSENVDELGTYLETIPGPDPDGPPRVLAGDFNTTLDHPEFRGVLERGYRDAADALGEGLAATWPSDGFPPGVAIDHVLGDERIEFSDLSVHPIDGSDHKAVIVSVSAPVS